VPTDSSHLTLLIKQSEQLQQLEAIIDAETAILQQKDPDALTEISEQKNSLLLAIQTLDQQFGQSPQFKLDKEQGLYTEQLSLIEATLIRCKNKNEVNGQIIQHSKIAIERLKTSLLENVNKSSMTYDKTGKTTGGLRSLGIKA